MQKIFLTILLLLALSMSSFSQFNQKSEFLSQNRKFALKVAKYYFTLADIYLELYDAEGRKPVVFDKLISFYKEGLSLDPADARNHYRLGYAYHMMRRLKEASEQYMKALKLDVPRFPDASEVEMVLRYAPRLYLHPQEYFGLKDVIAVVHPSKPVIGYHFFWEDDIDYPADNDPADHEVVWIEFDRVSGRVTGVYTYFHRAVLSTTQAVIDANQHNRRAKISIQWGQHGSLPIGFENITPVAVYPITGIKKKLRTLQARYNQAIIGRKNPDHPLGKSWPEKFKGTYKDYTTYTKELDIRPILRKKKMIIISKWPNAVIDYYFLHYNFFPKKEWPWGVDAK